MKTKIELTPTVFRNNYTAQFKEQILECANRDGIPMEAQDFVLAESMLHSWRSKRRQTGQPSEDQKLQQAELAHLKAKMPVWKIGRIRLFKPAGNLLG